MSSLELKCSRFFRKNDWKTATASQIHVFYKAHKQFAHGHGAKNKNSSGLQTKVPILNSILEQQDASTHLFPWQYGRICARFSQEYGYQVWMCKKIKFPKSELNLKFTFLGGQAFRWKPIDSDKWIGIFSHRVWTLWQNDDYIMYESKQKSDKIQLNNNATKNLDEENLLKNYFRLNIELSKLYDEWGKCDPYFEKAALKFQGVRMLQQDPIENLFTFICSSNNNIARITSMVDKMCRFYGEEIAEINGTVYYDFPVLEKLAAPSVKNDLEKAAFGYRAKFIQTAAAKIIELGGLIWINNLTSLPYAEAKLELMKLPGIGAKVADCICLMSLNHLGAIPVDTHVFQIATKYYLPHLKTVKSVTQRVYNEIGDHFRNLYGKYAGWPHCVLFCAELKIFQYDNDTDKNTKRKELTDEPSLKKKKKLK